MSPPHTLIQSTWKLLVLFGVQFITFIPSLVGEKIYVVGGGKPQEGTTTLVHATALFALGFFIFDSIFGAVKFIFYQFFYFILPAT